MTTAQHRKAILARIADTTYHIQQASAEGRRDATALANWVYLFQTGQYRKARAWWFSEIEPTTAIEEHDHAAQ